MSADISLLNDTILNLDSLDLTVLTQRLNWISGNISAHDMGMLLFLQAINNDIMDFQSNVNTTFADIENMLEDLETLNGMTEELAEISAAVEESKISVLESLKAENQSQDIRLDLNQALLMLIVSMILINMFMRRRKETPTTHKEEVPDTSNTTQADFSY